jgi:hypothetical protein
MKKKILIEILPIQGVSNIRPVHYCSGFESVSFWASRIRIRNYLYGVGFCAGSLHQQAKKILRKTLVASDL